MTLYRGRVTSVWRHRRDSARMDLPAELPPVSVIVYTEDNPSSLTRQLEILLQQDYPAPFEVIIVNDGSSEDVKDIFNRLSVQYRNLFQTYIPDEAHFLSRRKLAITLGIKGAHYDHVLIVDASSQVNSRRWLKSMARHFADGKDVVLGYAVYDKYDDEKMGKRLRSFDTVADAVTYFSAAISGNPYRGHGGNMGLNRKLFFKYKGFSRSLNLHNGEDDIFISEIANGENCAVELSSESIVMLKDEHPRRVHRRWKWSHVFTGKRVSCRSRMMFGIYSHLAWSHFGAGLGAAIVALPNDVPAAIALLFWVATWVVIALAWRKASRVLKGRKLFMTIPWFVLMRPFYNLYYRIVERRHRKESFTWNKLSRS